MGVAFAIFLVIAALLPTPSPLPSTPRHPVGSDVTLSEGTGEVIVVVSEAAFQEMVKLAVANDTRGLAQMVVRGQAFLVPDGTRAKIIDRGFERRRVRILLGPQRDADGWVPVSAIR